MALIIFCCIAVWLCGPIQGGEKKYEIHPYVDVSQYQNPPSWNIDAYEHLMDRYMDMTRDNFLTTARDIEGISQILGSIDARLAQLSNRLARIENHLGITKPKPKPSALKQSIPATDQDLPATN